MSASTDVTTLSQKRTMEHAKECAARTTGAYATGLSGPKAKDACSRRRGGARALTRWVAAALAFAVFTGAGVTLTATEAAAQVYKVKDKQLRDRTKRENERRIAELGLKLWELDEMLRQAEGLVALAERAMTITDIKDAVDVFVGGGDILGYATDDVELLYNDVFVAYDLPTNFEDYYAGSADVLLDTYKDLLLATREQMDTVPWSELAIEDLKAQVESEADNQMKALQMQSAVELFKAEELMLLRQALAIQTNAQALLGAYETNKEAIEVGVVRRFLQGE